MLERLHVRRQQPGYLQSADLPVDLGGEVPLTYCGVFGVDAGRKIRAALTFGVGGPQRSRIYPQW